MQVICQGKVYDVEVQRQPSGLLRASVPDLPGFEVMGYSLEGLLLALPKAAAVWDQDK